MMKNSIKFLIFILIILSFLTCDKDGGVGPCVHTFKEPILHVISIQDTLNNIFLSSVKLYDLKINGSKKLDDIVLDKSYSIVLDDSIYNCNIPFGFSTEEGKYEFIIKAENYDPKHFTIENVSYSVLKGGCPSYNDGGMRVELFIN